MVRRQDGRRYAPPRGHNKYMQRRRGEDVATANFQIGPTAKVFTEDFREVEPGSGEPGMIATSGSIPLGYYKDEERTARTFPTIKGVRYSMAGDWCRVDCNLLLSCSTKWLRKCLAIS